MDSMAILAIAMMGVVWLVLLGVAVSIYQKVPPNQAMIVFGATGTRVITGGGSPVWPMIEQRAYISLEVMTIDVVTAAPVMTVNKITVKIRAVAQVKVRRDTESILAAAEMFLGKSDQEVQALVHEYLNGALRAVAGTLTPEQIDENPDAFSMKVQQSSIPNLAKFGMTIISFALKEVVDLRSQNTGHLVQDASLPTTGNTVPAFSDLLEAAYAVDNRDSAASIEWLINRLSQLDQIADVLIKLDRSESKTEKFGLAPSKQSLLSGFEAAAGKLASLKDARLRRVGQNALVDSFSHPDEAA